MSLLNLFILLVVAGVCGSIGQAITGYSRGGCLGSIAIGFIGSLVGLWVARLLGMDELFTVSIGGHSFPVLWSIAGAALFVAILSVLTGRRK